MQMKALRSLNFATLSSSNSTRDAYWVTSTSAGTPAGYCLSQIRSMVFPLPVCLTRFGTGGLVLGSIEQCGGPWQAAANYRHIVNRDGAVGAAEIQLRCAVRWLDPPDWPRWSCSSASA